MAITNKPLNDKAYVDKEGLKSLIDRIAGLRQAVYNDMANCFLEEDFDNFLVNTDDNDFGAILEAVQGIVDDGGLPGA